MPPSILPSNIMNSVFKNSIWVIHAHQRCYSLMHTIGSNTSKGKKASCFSSFEVFFYWNYYYYAFYYLKNNKKCLQSCMRIQNKVSWFLEVTVNHRAWRSPLHPLCINYNNLHNLWLVSLQPSLKAVKTTLHAPQVTPSPGPITVYCPSITEKDQPFPFQSSHDI